MADRITWLRHQFKGEGPRLRNAGLLALITALAAMALLGLSGWFISAAALAGLAAGGPAVAFNLLVPSAGIRALAVGRTVSRYFERLVSHDATFHVMQRLRTQLFAAILPRIPGPLSSLSSGHLLERLLGDVERLENAWLGQGQPALVATATAVVLLLAGFWIAGPVAALAMLAGFIVMFLLLRRLSKVSTEPLEQRARQREQLRGDLVQTLHGLPDVLAYGLRPSLLEQWRRRLADLAGLEHRLALRHAITQTLIQSLMQWLAVAMLLILITPVRQEMIDAPMALALMLLVLAAAEVTLPLAQAWQGWPDTRATVTRLDTLTGTPIPPPAACGSEIPRADGHLRVRGLSFAWPGQPALFSGLDLQARAGVPLAIVGPSGSGKSTLLHCLMGLQRISAGEIRFGGVSQERADSDAWRQCFALLLQQQQLFTGTLRDNLRLARPDANDERLWQVLEQARLADLVRQRGGLDHWIGTNGMHLSGGQGRRLSLARVLLRDSPVILLDEPFTGLEPATADALFDTLHSTLNDRVLIMVTHDRRHAERMENQLVLDV
ncbi:Putative ABC-type Xenobiotic transport system,ATPase and permease component [Alloalcanivorax dieselolei B5]|uniref:Putative ABC-type Xenobiotic transport system,ATPase and permease component n=1 Tax=Alcanivorax dieselolei (strain DSM 16502 / CGMCC 1.3690 / MCCC 1A00001 / B-5) TaxID=930169 RepID=K0CCM9_ALCDB|nr:thiol reductant ABC exporter subunit CydC [Alloalcanivorax dieselolei]AFT71319.1 Putative ABC-type Xenobiotic transport system,ATPase and permease component [Alloalcanivorax dieselolei B5]GGJ94825.1 thiol reductant ABC exporter subunit CydC [Alloalcanivorax dieselolei]